MIFKIPAFDHVAIDRRPFAKNDGPRIVADSAECERVPPDDVSVQDVFDRIQAFIAKKAPVTVFKDREKPFPAFSDIVLKDIDAVDRANGQHSVPLVIRRAFSIAALDDAQLAIENLAQKVAGPARWFKKAGLDALRFLLDEVQHGVHFLLARQHLAMILDSQF